MKCHSLFSGKNKKNIINLSSAVHAQRVVKVNIFKRYILSHCSTFRHLDNSVFVAGHDGQIKLINPRQLVMFGVMEGHRCYISSLIFHPKDKNILFSELILMYQQSKYCNTKKYI